MALDLLYLTFKDIIQRMADWGPTAPVIGHYFTDCSWTAVTATAASPQLLLSLLELLDGIVNKCWRSSFVT